MDGNELIATADVLAARHEEFESKHAVTLRRIVQSANEIGRSWSGSNLGYHAEVYYADLAPRPPGAQFSAEWGLDPVFGDMGSRGDWREFDPEKVTTEIYRRAGNPDLSVIRQEAEALTKAVELTKADLVSVLSIVLRDREDSFLSDLREKAQKTKLLNLDDLIRTLMPRGQIMSGDSLAITQGLRSAPHQQIIADIASINQGSTWAKELEVIVRQAGSHLIRLERKGLKASLVGTNVFIGHGQAPVWMVLKDFVRDRLRLPYDEFNRVPVAGLTNISRLSEMLDAAAIAFLVLTAEDEQSDGRLQARMNVVHEVGLFQGRLGFGRAIVLLEDGCEEFSNISGLGQIRFPKGRIESAFEELRRVLEREGLL